MAKTLVIVESPTKAKTISKYLGKDYTVLSSFGHVRDLPKSKMGVDIESGTFEPKYVISREKREQVKKIKDAAKKSDEVIFATDEDREGEAISWHLAHILDIDVEESKRIVFHEITKRAIEKALENPRKINKELVDAQQARRILDRLVGYELSPLLWKKVARGLSAGRVQSVALKIIVEREKEIRAFTAEEYWTLEALFNKEKHEFEAKLHSKDGKKYQKLDIKDKESSDKILSDLKDAEYTIKTITKKQAKRNPSPPFRTSTLQQQAHQKFGFSSRQTMRLAQQLYEGIKTSDGTHGLITYMRTDSTNLSNQFVNEATQFILDNYGDKYSVKEKRVFSKKAKGAQEAHEAIRPTEAARTPQSLAPYLDAQQLKLYTLIWNRSIATQMAAAQLNRTTIDIEAKKYSFRATGQTMVFDGWLKLYPKSVSENMLPELKEGEKIDCKDLSATQHFTEPPPRYSDATLVKVLEEHGIGRPSTYAPTIATIEARGYVTRNDNKKFVPSDIAIIVTDLLDNHFHSIVDYQFTATMESNLDDIALGEKDWHPVIAMFYHPFHETIEQKTEELQKEALVHITELGTDPKTGKPVVARIGRYGPFVQLGDKDDEEKPKFASLPEGKSVDTITLEEALVLLSLPKTLGQTPEGEDIIVSLGRFGPYVKVGKTYFSIKDKDPYTITLEEAEKVIKEGKEANAKKIIKEFKDSEIIIKNGPYGPYVTNGKKNARIPKETDPETLTLAQCEELIKNAKPGRRRGKKKTTKKKK